MRLNQNNYEWNGSCARSFLEKPMLKAFCMFVALATFVGCTANVPEAPKNSTVGENVVQTPANENGQVPASATPATQVEGQNKDLAAVVEGNNEFALDLYRRLAQKPGNKVFSPYSISTALAMTYAGAKGSTAKQMAQTLHFALENERLHPAFGELIRKVQGDATKRNYELGVANSLWGAKGLSVLPNFLQVAQDNYQGLLQFVDFANDPDGARERINGWVKDQTKKRITELLKKGVVGTDTRLVLVNAIYFNAEWAMPFPQTETRLEDFNIAASQVIKVLMMNRRFATNYMATSEFQLAEFMYKNNELSLVVIIPRQIDGLANLERKLSAKALAEWLSSVKHVQLAVSLPRLKVSEVFNIGRELMVLGMKDAFTARANFSGISSLDKLFVSNVVHEGFLQIDEMGTEAGGATAVMMALSRPIAFRANHPFLFILVHRPTMSVLILGRASDPRAQ